MRRLMLLAAVCLAALPLKAQKDRLSTITDVKAAIEAMEKVIPHYSYAQIVPIIDEICGKFKNNPEVYVGMANAIAYKSGTADTLHASEYINKALAIDRNYAPAYVLKGDIAKWFEDTTACVRWYKQAIAANATYLPGYTRMADLYGRMNMLDSVEVLYRQAKDAVPTFPYHLRMAAVYYASSRLSDQTKALQQYAEAERDSMTVPDFTAHATLYNMLASQAGGRAEQYAHYRKMFGICADGLTMYPSDYHLLSVGMQAALKACGTATAGTDLWRDMAQNADSVGSVLMQTYANDTLIRVYDYNNYAMSLKYRGKYDEAVKIYQQVMDMAKATDAEKNTAMKNMAACYREQGEYGKAEGLYAKYMADKEKKGTLTFFDMEEYAQMFVTKADEENGADKVATFWRADSVYGKAAVKFIDYADYAYHMQVKIRGQRELDPDRKQGLFLDPAMKLWNLLRAKGTMTEREKELLFVPALYTAIYYSVTKKDHRRAKPFWMMCYDINPTHSTVLSALKNIYKMKV